MFRTAILALIASAASATFAPNGDIAADSTLGARLLSVATVLEDARHLEQNERDVTFVASYSLRYVGCSTLLQVRGEEGGGGNDGNGMLYTQHLVKFALCPGGCSSCSNGGEYVVNMEQFVDLYTEHKLNDKEYACEMIRENCYCDNANDDEVCENSCYAAQGMSECIEYEGEEEFEVQRYMECQEMEGGNNNNNNNQNNGNYDANAYYGNYYVGPYCAKDGKSIHLGVFKDEGCSVQADDSIYASKNYGVNLPFSASTGTPLVLSSDCISCVDVERENENNNNNNNNNGNNNNNNNQNNAEVNELCENSYEMAARCETNMDIYYKDTSACDYINNVLPRLEGASRAISTKSGSGKGAKAFATIFAFTTALFAGYAYFLYRKIKRGSVNLSAQE